MTLVDGRPAAQRDVHDLWVVVDQDCELAWEALVTSSDARVELRPLSSEQPPPDWGIRSRRFRLNEDGEFIDNDQPRLHVHPAVVAAAEHVGCLEVSEARRLKTWLGLRYDRPAIPARYGVLARALAKEISARRYGVRAEPVRDVLARFSTEPSGQVTYELVAVLADGEGVNELLDSTEEWLAEAVRKVPIELGSARLIEARTDRQVSLAYLENSYSLDVTTVSWPRSVPGPKGEARGG